jgi:hypothetical protein
MRQRRVARATGGCIMEERVAGRRHREQPNLKETSDDDQVDSAHMGASQAHS